ncbi:hypothetical protein D3C79_576180 [compost metagenome]
MIGGGRDVAQHVALVVIEGAHLQQLQHAVHAGDGGAQLVAHGGEEPAAHLGRLLRHPPGLAQLQLLALELGDVLHHAIQDDPLQPLLSHEVAPDLQVARLSLTPDLHLEIQRLHGQGMALHRGHEVMQGLPRQPQQGVVGRLGPHHLLEPLRGVEEAAVARS